MVVKSMLFNGRIDGGALSLHAFFSRSKRGLFSSNAEDCAPQKPVCFPLSPDWIGFSEVCGFANLGKHFSGNVSLGS